VRCGRLSPEESSRLFAEAEAHIKREAQLEDYARRLRLLVARVGADGLDARLGEARLDYRRTLLQARDRLLAALSPAASRALARFVESRRAEIRIAVRRADLASFLLPE
jgi:hypothetical protein